MRFFSSSFLFWLCFSCVCGVDVSHSHFHSHSHSLSAFDGAGADAVADVWSRHEQLNRERVNSLVEENGYELLEILGGGGEKESKIGQVGLEIEIHSPRIVMYSRDKGKKAQKTVPQFYSAKWATSENGLWSITTDNEHTHIGEMKDEDPLKEAYLKLWGKLVNPADPTMGKVSLQGDLCGLNTAMEIITQPIDTDSKDAKDDHLLIQMTLRLFVKVLKSFKNGEYLGLDEHGKKLVEYETCTQLAVAVPGVDGSTHYCVLFEQVRQKLNDELFRLAATAQKRNHILQKIIYYKLLPEVLPSHVMDYSNTNTWSDRKTRAGLLSEYQVYMVFPKSPKLAFKYAAQVNFGYPIVNFANDEDDKKWLHKHVATISYKNKLINGKPQTRSSRFKFTKYILPGIIKYGKALGTLVDEKQQLSQRDRQDVQGLMVATLYFYFHFAYMGCVSKGAQNVLIKTPLNEVVRALPSAAKIALATFVTDLELDVMIQLFEKVSKDIYTAAKLEEKRYFPIETEQDRESFKHDTIYGIFEFHPEYKRYVDETQTAYGNFQNVRLAKTDKTVEDVTVSAKPIHPLQIRGRVGVLLESRFVRFPFNIAWGNLDTYGEFDDTFDQIKRTIDTNLKTMEQLQTTFIQTQQQQQQQQHHHSIISTDTSHDDDDGPDIPTKFKVSHDYSADVKDKLTRCVREMSLESSTTHPFNTPNVFRGSKSKSKIIVTRQESNNGIDPNDDTDTEPKDTSPSPQFKTVQQIVPLLKDIVTKIKQKRQQTTQAKKKII